MKFTSATVRVRIAQGRWWRSDRIATVMSADKSTRLVKGIHSATGAAIEGYEIHLGHSEGPDRARPVVTIDERHDGASNANGRVQGTYVHGLFTGDAFRKAWLGPLGIAFSLAYTSEIESALEALGGPVG